MTVTSVGKNGRLLTVIKHLQNHEKGCTWGIVQAAASIAPYEIEGAYEVMDAIAHSDRADIPDELGDLLLQVVYQAQMAEEAGQFDFETVAKLLADKMVRRHPHLFGDETGHSLAIWEQPKDKERRAKSEHGAVAGSPLHLP